MLSHYYFIFLVLTSHLSLPAFFYTILHHFAPLSQNQLSKTPPLSPSNRADSRSFPFNNPESAPHANTPCSYPSNLASDRCVGAVDPKQASSPSDVGELQPGTPFTTHHTPNWCLAPSESQLSHFIVHSRLDRFNTCSMFLCEPTLAMTFYLHLAVSLPSFSS